MKPFNLEEAKAGKPVRTRSGNRANILIYDSEDVRYPIVALVYFDDGTTCPHAYSKDGLWDIGNEDENDLFMIDEKEEENSMSNKYVIVRTYSAGVFAGELISRKGGEVVLHNARRLWYWSGAASLSQLAMEGVKNPDECKFPCEVDRIELLEAIEILDCTEISRKSINEVKIWEA